MLKTFSIIVAVDQKNGIGKDGMLPWNLPADMKHFKATTLETSSSDQINAVVMGRKTWESIPEKWRPLAGRLNVVLTANDDYILPEGVLKFQGFDQALKALSGKEYQKRMEHIFVIGGASVYTQAVSHPLCDKIYLTSIEGDFGCDVFFPEFKRSFEQKGFSREYSEHGVKFSFAVYERRKN
jgi:dihydrofolate reductase